MHVPVGQSSMEPSELLAHRLLLHHLKVTADRRGSTHYNLTLTTALTTGGTGQRGYLWLHSKFKPSQMGRKRMRRVEGLTGGGVYPPPLYGSASSVTRCLQVSGSPWLIPGCCLRVFHVSWVLSHCSSPGALCESLKLNPVSGSALLT